MTNVNAAVSSLLVENLSEQLKPNKPIYSLLFTENVREHQTGENKELRWKVRSRGYRSQSNSGRNCWTSWTTRTSAEAEAQGRTFLKEKSKGGRWGNERKRKKHRKIQENLEGKVFHKLWAKMVACKNWTTSSPNNGFVYTTNSREHHYHIPDIDWGHSVATSSLPPAKGSQWIVRWISLLPSIHSN